MIQLLVQFTECVAKYKPNETRANQSEYPNSIFKNNLETFAKRLCRFRIRFMF